MSVPQVASHEARQHGTWDAQRRRWRRTLHHLAFLPAVMGATWMLRIEQSTLVDAVDAEPGVELILCLDVSRSMLARDLAPSRLARAQAEIRALAEAAPADLLSLVAFAGEARIVVPPTHDAALFADLAALCGPHSLSRGGSDLGSGLEAATTMLTEQLTRPVTVLVLTDGEDLEGRGARAAQELARRGVIVHCFGFGSERGSKIVVPGPGGESFLRDANGREVVSALDATALRGLAQSTGGDYFPIGPEVGALREVYRAQVLPLTRRAALAAADSSARTPSALLLLAGLLWILILATRDGRRP